MATYRGLMASEPGINAAESTDAGLYNEPGIIETPPEMPPPGIVQEAAPVEPPRPQTNANDMSDLFEVPQEDDPDIYSDDLVELDDEDVMGGDSDMSDLTSVSREDVMGRPLKKRRRPQQAPPPSMGGMQI
jgi:hypothetical protein